MSLHAYEEARRIAAGLPFDALIMAAAMRADSDNLAHLRAAFPYLVVEQERRYNAPGARLPEDGPRA